MAKYYACKNKNEEDLKTFQQERKRSRESSKRSGCLTTSSIVFFIFMIFVLPRTGSGSFGFIAFGASIIALICLCVGALKALVRSGHKGPWVNEGAIKAGIDGEQLARDAVIWLPSDDYNVITNAIITYQGKSSETDVIVVGPTGVFVIEAKNLSGRVVGDAHSQEWTQHKAFRGGGGETRRFYNPVKQVGTHVYRLSNYLKQYNVDVWVQGIVYIADPDTLVYVECDENTPVFAASDGPSVVEDYILKSKLRNPLTKDMIKRAVDCIIKENQLKENSPQR